MRRATNNKRGRWVEVAFKTRDSRQVCAPTFYAYEMRQGERRYYVVFTQGGELWDTDLKVLAAVPIEPPKWAANLWDISDEAKKIGHYALLYDARYKTIIADSYEGRLSREIRDYQRYINLFEKLKAKEPWK